MSVEEFTPKTSTKNKDVVLIHEEKRRHKRRTNQPPIKMLISNDYLFL